MPNEELKTFINKMRAAGKTDPEITAELKTTGWPEADIASALNPQPVLTVDSQPTPQPILGQTSQEKLWFETTWAGLLLPLILSGVGVGILVFCFIKNKRRMPFVLKLWLLIQIVLFGALLFAVLSTLIQKAL